jgi:hypothetical protein
MAFSMTEKSWYSTYRSVTWIAVLIYYIFLSANVNSAIQHSRWKKSRSEIRFCFSKTDCFSGKIIGTNSNYCFAMVDDKIKIIPINSQLAFIELSR